VTEERARRIGLNEGIFRAVNERLEALIEEAGLAEEKLDLLCECGSAECTHRLKMSLEAYEHLRADSTTFAVIPGHERLEVEAIVEQGDGYNVVRKLDPEAAKMARATDPRR